MYMPICTKRQTKKRAAGEVRMRRDQSVAAGRMVLENIIRYQMAPPTRR